MERRATVLKMAAHETVSRRQDKPPAVSSAMARELLAMTSEFPDSKGGIFSSA